ncbi:MAG: hypothetical protein ABL973_06560 [Micropepsaceae bacterium]
MAFRALLIVFALIVAPTARAREVPRTILGLHDAPLTASQDANYLYALAEMPLNHLGLRLEYHNLRSGVPEISGRQDLRGVLIWLSDGQKLPLAGMLALVRKASSIGIPVIFMGSLPNGKDTSGHIVSLADQNALLNLIGLKSSGTFLPYTFDLKTTIKNSKMVEFERKLPNPPPATESISPTTTDVQTFLAFDRSGDEGERIHAVILTRTGGYVASGFTHFESRNGTFIQWYLNPFDFFATAFRTRGIPVPDTTTLAGRRIFYSHIDGDGWGNVSTADRYDGKGTYASEVILREVVDAYPDLPVTIAPIAADLDLAFAGSVRSQQIARALFSRRNVEPATHTYTHPFEWRFFGPGYRAENELPFLKKYGKYHLGPGIDPKKGSVKANLNKHYDAPRAYGDIPYNLKREVEGSVAYINAFCPPNKQVRMLQWSGDTSPTVDAVASVMRAGLQNLNGRDTRFDGEAPSYAAVSPIGKLSGSLMQISASHANENVYTDLWQGRFFGFRYLKSSLANTETPRRVKPINIYYHMYSGEKQASLAALKEVLDYSAAQDIAPITASEFAAVGQGFFSARLNEIGPQSWRVEDRGRLNTLRIDGASSTEINPDHSSGILGSNRQSDTMYVALDPAVSVPIVTLRTRTTLPVQRPTLVESRWTVSSLNYDQDSATFQVRGFGPGTMVWSVPQRSKGERWEARAGSVTYLSGPADSNGIIKFQIPRGAEDGMTITIKRSDLRPALL